MATRRLNIAYGGVLAGIEEAHLSNLDKKSNWWKKYFWTYQNHSVDFSTRTAYYLIKAIEILKEKGIGPEDLHFTFWGSISPINQSQINKAGIVDYFTIDGYISKDESFKRLNQADILFLPQEMSASHEHRSLFIPGKLYEYLKAGKPILALSEPSDCQEIIKASGLGIICSPNDPEDIAEKILILLSKTDVMEDIHVNHELIDAYAFQNKARRIAQIFNEVLEND